MKWITQHQYAHHETGEITKHINTSEITILKTIKTITPNEYNTTRVITHTHIYKPTNTKQLELFGTTSE